MDKRKRKVDADNSEKNVERFQKKMLIEKEKRKKPGECQKYLRAIIDKNVTDEIIGSKIISNLSLLEIKYELKQQLIPRTICWQRQQQQTFVSADNCLQLTEKFQDEEHLIHIMTAAELNSYIQNKTLSDHINHIQNIYANKQLTIFIFGLKEYCRNNRTNVGRLAFETALTEIQLVNNVNHRLMDTAEDIGNTVMQFSKSIAEIPYKTDRAEKNAEQNFYMANDNKDCIQVKGEIGLSNLWQRHLNKLPLVTLESAEAIMTNYPMPSSLIKTYESNDTNGALLLADIPIRRSAGALSSVRKIGIELSKKIHALYTNTNPNYVL